MSEIPEIQISLTDIQSRPDFRVYLRQALVDTLQLNLSKLKNSDFKREVEEECKAYPTYESLVKRLAELNEFTPNDDEVAEMAKDYYLDDLYHKNFKEKELIN